jgi:hypothetical protein
MHDFFDKPLGARARLLAAAALLGACGGAVQAREATLNDAFARIQVHEARIADASAVLSRADTACADRETAAAGVCEQRDAICAIARDVVDADALTRCERAEGACTAAHGEADVLCDTPRASHTSAANADAAGAAASASRPGAAKASAATTSGAR